jgi:hypothetical protein
MNYRRGRNDEYGDRWGSDYDTADRGMFDRGRSMERDRGIGMDRVDRDRGLMRGDYDRGFSYGRNFSDRDYADRDYSIRRDYGDRDYGSGRGSSDRDYGSSRGTSDRDYGSSRGSSDRDYGSNRGSSDRDYRAGRNYDSGYYGEYDQERNEHIYGGGVGSLADYRGSHHGYDTERWEPTPERGYGRYDNDRSSYRHEAGYDQSYGGYDSRADLDRQRSRYGSHDDDERGFTDRIREGWDRMKESVRDWTGRDRDDEYDRPQRFDSYDRDEYPRYDPDRPSGRGRGDW